MFKYRGTLRLRAAGISMRNIAYSCGCSKTTVKNAVDKAKARGLEWPLSVEVGDVVPSDAPLFALVSMSCTAEFGGGMRPRSRGCSCRWRGGARRPGS